MIGADTAAWLIVAISCAAMVGALLFDRFKKR